MNKLYPIVLSSLISCTAAWGIGIRVTDQDAAATARGDAFTATADNPSAVYYNPAGITQLDGFQARLGTYDIEVDAEFRSPTGEFIHNKDTFVELPQFYSTYHFANTPITAGLGIYVPYGLSLSYPSTAPFSTTIQGARIEYQTVNPVIAWQICPQLSIAAGVTINYAEASQRIKVLQQGVNGEFKIEGSGEDVGFNFGLMWQPTPQHSFGIQYHSATDVDLSGHTLIDTDRLTVPTPFGNVRVPASHVERDSDANFHFPQWVTAGYSFRPTPKWNLEFDLDWTDWNTLNTVYVHQAGAPEVKIPFNWVNSIAFEFGVTRQLPWGMRISAGYQYAQHTVPEDQFNPIVPDNRRHIFMVGIGQTKGRFSWDAAYEYAYQPSRSISDESSIDGDYRLRASAFTVSLGYKY